jgi:hypothetical protein
MALLMVSGITAAATAPAGAGMVVHANAPVAKVSPYMVGAGIEDVNHELIGGLSTQLIWGESFEEPASNASAGVSSAGKNGYPTWMPTTTSGTGCEFELVRNIAAQTGQQSQFIGAPPGAGGGCAVRNRGLDFGGHFFAGGEAYAGHFFVKGDTAATVVVSLFDWQASKALATQTLSIPAAAAWTMTNFTLTPAASTQCFTATVSKENTCSHNAENLCPICTGEFHISVTKGAVMLDQVFLEQSSARFGGGSQRTRREVVGLVKDTMGFGVLRNGGSQCNALGYRWKRFRGPAWDRQPFDGTWYRLRVISMATGIMI